MKVMHSIIFGYVFTAAFVMTVERLPGNFIGFDSAPDKVVNGSVVRVRYQCSRPCQLAVEVVVSTLSETDLVVFRRKWISNTVRDYRIHQVLLRLPPSVLYQQDFFNRHVLDAQNLTVRAWLGHRNEGSEPGTYHGSVLRIYKVLQIKPLSERPTKPSTACSSWSAQLMWQMSRNRVRYCPHESAAINMLKFPLASSGEHFGVVRRFQPFIDRSLERARRHAMTQPSITLSVWIYLLKWCHSKLCGIIHHIDGNNSYASVLMQLTDTGNVIIQARVTTGEDEAFQSRVVLPLWKWIRLDCYIQNSKVVVDVTWDDKTNKAEYNFQENIRYDDTDGYFVIGGSKYIPGIHGYFGPMKYYRFGTKEVRNQLDPESALQELDKTHQECREIKALTQAFLQQVTKSHLPTPINKGSLGMKELRSTLFDQAVNTVFTIDQAQHKITTKSTSLLQIFSCFGNHKASLLLASIYLSGLGQSVDQQQGHVYSLIGAAADNRFALMHAGYKHAQGIDGFPKDFDVAYGYLSNIGEQTTADNSRIHEKEQYTPEHIYLSNEDFLRSLTEETGDVIEYLKFQAERGDVESQGQGVKRNYTRGLQLLEKAAAMGSINALNGLGWYHGIILKDDKSAVKYFKQAALNGSGDAMFNLGIYHLSGADPDMPWRNETAAFQQFLNASRLGHVAASVEAAWYLSTGSLEGVSQDVERAVMQEAFAKYVLAAETGLGFAQSNVAHLCEGMYNLVVLAQQGHRLPSSMHGFFNVSHRDEQDVVVEKILQRCLKTEDEEAVTPCSLALLRVQMGKALRRMTQNNVCISSLHPHHYGHLAITEFSCNVSNYNCQLFLANMDANHRFLKSRCEAQSVVAPVDAILAVLQKVDGAKTV
ncbi:Protein sel-1-like protein 3 [Nibea albiflora]|uniref:Protein sel-1-like protein 3 n=1 Tax=Nibea albiflora TaxID=240163 RepID=A0ACB7EN42_NIBAL|nr:Protein sel-1-like protein 3 [Nibea albiflora]